MQQAIYGLVAACCWLARAGLEGQWLGLVVTKKDVADNNEGRGGRVETGTGERHASRGEWTYPLLQSSTQLSRLKLKNFRCLGW